MAHPPKGGGPPIVRSIPGTRQLNRETLGNKFVGDTKHAPKPPKSDAPKRKF